MASINKVILIGHLGRDPELRYTPGGAAVATLSLATTRSWKQRDTGERQEETEWHRLVCYDRLAEIAGEYLKKGKPAYIEGRLKTRKWQDKDGKDQHTTEIVVEQLQMLGGRDSGDDREAAATTGRPQLPEAARASPGRPAPRERGPVAAGFDGDDDIPF